MIFVTVDCNARSSMDQPQGSNKRPRKAENEGSEKEETIYCCVAKRQVLFPTSNTTVDVKTLAKSRRVEENIDVVEFGSLIDPSVASSTQGRLLKMVRQAICEPILFRNVHHIPMEMLERVAALIDANSKLVRSRVCVLLDIDETMAHCVFQGHADESVRWVRKLVDKKLEYFVASHQDCVLVYVVRPYARAMLQLWERLGHKVVITTHAVEWAAQAFRSKFGLDSPVYSRCNSFNPAIPKSFLQMGESFDHNEFGQIFVVDDNPNNFLLESFAMEKVRLCPVTKYRPQYMPESDSWKGLYDDVLKTLLFLFQQHN